jgi:hypothetical protein
MWTSVYTLLCAQSRANVRHIHRQLHFSYGLWSRVGMSFHEEKRLLSPGGLLALIPRLVRLTRVPVDPTIARYVPPSYDAM